MPPAKRSNIAGQTFEICLSSKMFDLQATSKKIARPKFFACVKQKMFLNFSKTSRPEFYLLLLVMQCWIIWPPFQHCFSNISFVIVMLQQLATFWNLATFLNNKLHVCALAKASLFKKLDSNVFGRGQTVKHLL